jgi:ribosomal protein S18 acetylase RimI-like enzyme
VLPHMTGPAPHQPGGFSLRPATESDVPSVAELVDAAYRHYVQRLGMLPRPMTDDYPAVIRDRQVTVAEHDGAIVGVNVAVHPSRRGTGLGRALLQFAEAEARRAGYDAIHLYTHEQMTENLALYSRIGYVEYDRRSQGHSGWSTCASSSDACGPDGVVPARRPGS